MRRSAAITSANICTLVTYAGASLSTMEQWNSSEHENAVIAPCGMALLVGSTMMAEKDRFLRLHAGGSLQDAAYDWCGLAVDEATERVDEGARDEWMEWVMTTCYEDVLALICDWHVDTIGIQGLLPFIAQFRPLRYIQIGAHTGEDYLHGNPMLSKRHGNKESTTDFSHSESATRPVGLIVEPVPSTFESIRKTAGNVYENAAICDETGIVKLYKVRSSVHPQTGVDQLTGRYLHPMATQIASLDHSFFVTQFEKLVNGRANVSEYLDVIDVPCLSVADLLSRHTQFVHADVLIIDAEGSDFSILRQFDLRNITLVVYENVHLPQKERQAAEQLLHRSGLTDTFTE